MAKIISFLERRRRTASVRAAQRAVLRELEQRRMPASPDEDWFRERARNAQRRGFERFLSRFGAVRLY